MTIKAVAKVLYGLFGSLFLVVGISVLLLRTPLLPDAVRAFIVDRARGDSNALHLVQEFGSLMVFAGLISFWFIRHYEQSSSFHWAMTTFWVLFALVHWFYVGGEIRSIAGPAINTAPFILFTLVGLLRKRSEGRAAFK